MFTKLKASITGEEPESNILEDVDNFCTLSYTNRMIGFGLCFLLGWFLAFLSLMFLFDIKDNPGKFATCFTIGSVLALLSTLFLSGPVNQLKNMFAPTRAIATCVYLGTMGLTLYLAFGVGKAGYVILSLIVQCVALLWYCLSYIPYGRDLIQKLCCSFCK